MPTDDAARPPADEFRTRLLEAMRVVAHRSRDAALEAARAQAARLVEEARRASALDAAEQQRRADQDAAEVATWREAEMARVRAEADQRLAARQDARQQEDAARREVTEREVLRVQALLADFETRLGHYHAELEQIADPAAFAVAAERWPAVPDFSRATPVVATTPAPSAAPERATTTFVVVAAHGSFGDVTAVKQALERLPGVRSVLLDVEHEEFVLAAEHDPSLDLRSALASLAMRGARIEGADGRLTVSLGPAA